MRPTAIRSANRLQIAYWDKRGYFLVDPDSQRRFLVDHDDRITDVAMVPEVNDAPVDKTKKPKNIPHGWTAGSGDRWAVMSFENLWVGRGTDKPRVLRMQRGSDKLRAVPAGITIGVEGVEHAITWEALEAPEIFVTPLRVQLATEQLCRVTILQAGPTILRVQHLQAKPGWRPTQTVASKGNPHGFVPGDEAYVAGNIVAGDLAILDVSRELRALTTGVKREEPFLFATGNAKQPAWIDALVEVGLVDNRDVIPEHTWLDAPLQALAQIYEPREAIDRGFVRYDWKWRRDTDDPLADFAALAQVKKAELGRIHVPSPGDLDSWSEILDKVNAKLAELGKPRRVYECPTGGDWYAFIGRTPAEMQRLIAAGIAVASDDEDRI